jgi:HEAT repeat protein
MTDAGSLVGDLLSDDDVRAETAVQALARLGPQALDLLAPILGAPEAESRWWAVRAAAEIPGVRSAQLLVAALEDREASIRQAAALGLRQHPSGVAAAALAQRLDDEDPLTARLASDALAALGEPALLELRRAARSVRPSARIHAVRALALLRSPAAIPDLFAGLDDSSTLVSHWAERGLEDLGVGMVFFRP